MGASVDSAPDAPPLVDRRFAFASAGAMLAVATLLWLAGWWARGWVSAWPRFQDDAYYYLVIARNAAVGHGFTMDQMSATNGFQPLWQWLLVALAWATGGDVEIFLAAAQVLSVLLFALAVGLLCGFARARLGSEPAIGIALLVLLPRFLNIALSGMESCLLILIETAVVLEATRSRALARLEPSAADARLGVWLGLLMLARLDSVFVLFAFAVAIGVRGLARGGEPPARRVLRVVAKELVVFAPAVALVTPYLIWNEVAFGHLVPISGVLKTSFPVAGWTPSHLPGEYLGLLVLGFAGPALALLVGRRGDELVRVLAVLCVGLALHALYTVVYMRWAIFAWHFASFLPAGALGAALAGNALAPRVPEGARRALLALGGVVIVLSLAVSVSRLSRSFTAASREAGEWVAHTLPPDAVLGMKDSGTFTYFAQRRVVNLDGVANSFAFEDALCRGELERYLRERGVEYVAQHSVPSHVRVGAYEVFVQEYPCRLDGGRDGRLALRRDLEVYRGPPYANDAGRLDQFFIWRLAPEGRATPD